MSVEEWGALMAAPLGPFSMILDPHNENSGLIGDMLGSSPVTKIASSIAALGLDVARRDKKGAKSNLRTILRYSMPGSSFPGWSPYWNTMLGGHVYRDKDQNQIFGGR